MNDAESVKSISNVYCPICETFGRKKLLFQARGKASGEIVIRCRGCKRDVEIILNNGEPLSRE